MSQDLRAKLFYQATDITIQHHAQSLLKAEELYSVSKPQVLQVVDFGTLSNNQNVLHT